MLIQQWMRGWHGILLLPLLIILAGCGGTVRMAASVASTQIVAQLPAPASTSVSLSPEAARRDRLLVTGRDGNLFTISPTGQQRLALTDDASRARIYSQPTWSGDGSRIAYVQVDAERSRLVTVHADGSDRQSIDLIFPPFYIFWNASSDGLAFLSNWVANNRPTLALTLVDFHQSPPKLIPISTGQPLYFSWSPDGQQLLTHIGNSEVSLTALDGSHTVLAESSGNFAAPQWLEDGSHLLYGINEAGRQQIVLADMNGRVEQAIAFNGVASFDSNRAGTKVAFVDTERSPGFNTFGPLYVFDFAEQIYQQVSDDRVLYFAWSPDGEKLLYFTLQREGGRLWMRAHVWDGKQNIALSRFLPTEIFFEQYLRFSDQYAQSQRYWSPDSRFFVFSGMRQDLRSGIWVQAVDGTGDPVYVAAGVHASWSPQ